MGPLLAFTPRDLRVTFDMSKAVTMRAANLAEASALSKLAMRSKAYWGYSDEFMKACRAELTVTPEKITSSAFYFVVAETKHQVVGFYAVEQLSSSQFELEALFVDPAHIGSGIGYALITHAKNYVALHGGHRLIIQSDPNAEEFYRTVGAQLINKRESASIPGRFLPVLSIEFSEDT